MSRRLAIVELVLAATSHERVHSFLTRDWKTLITSNPRPARSCAGRDMLVKIWRLEDGKHVRDLGQGRGGQFKDWICAIAISPDGKRLVAADMAGQVQVYALSN